MSDNIVEITQTSDYTISIDTSLIQNDNNVTIELSSPNTVDIIDFIITNEEIDDRVNNLLIAGNYILLNYNDSNNTLTISTSGLQPSGNYSLVGHTHLSSDITDFNSSVSGLIPPSSFTSLTGISGIVVTNSGTNYFVSLNDPTIQLIDITDLSTNARTFLLTPSSSNLQTLITNETGSGLVVFNNSPDFSGVPTVPTAPSGTNTTQIANTAFVRTEINNLIDFAPNTLDTLNELAAALGDDANFATTVTNSLANKANLSGAIFTGSVTIPSGTGNFNVLNVNGTGVSLVGHTHTSSNIVDFNSSVSGLLPSVTGSGYAISSFNNNIYTIEVTGVQPSGNYSLVGHTHISSDITDFNSSVSGLLPTINNSENNRVLTSTGSSFGIDAESYLTFNNNTLTIGSINNPNASIINIYNNNQDDDIAGLRVLNTNNVEKLLIASQGDEKSNYILNNEYDFYILAGTESIYLKDRRNDPGVSGVYIQTSNNLFINNIPVSVSGHNHLSSDITNFNSSVSGLLPVKDILPGSGIGITSLSGNYTVSVTGTFGLTGEEVDDRVNQLLIASSGITLNYNDNSNSLTIGTSGLAFVSGANFDNLFVTSIPVSLSGHQHQTSDIINFNTAISGLLPSVTGSGYVSSSFSNNIYTISVSGLQPSGNYSVVGHSHNSSDITNFNTSVSGLLPSVTGSGYVVSSFDNNTYTISVTGLQPSGNYSLVGHTHSSSDITDFNSAVSGLIPVKDVVSGTGILVNNVSGIYTVNSIVEEVERASSLVTTVFNKTGSPIPKFSVVYINGGQGDQPTINLAIASGESTSSKTYGITYEAINNMDSGRVIVEGALTDVNTDQFNPTAPTGDVNGTILYLSPTISGGVTTTKPSAPNHLVAVGTIVRTHQNAGVVEVRIQNGFELQELHNVAISGVTSGQFLQYNGTNLWIPSSSGNFSSLSINGTGVSVNGHTHTSSQITDFNSSVSGLLPTIANSGDNRILTSTGSSVGINAENNLTFDGSLLTVTGSGNFNNIFISGVSISEVIDDEVASLLVAGTGITLDYNDNSNTLTINSTVTSSTDNIHPFLLGGM